MGGTIHAKVPFNTGSTDRAILFLQEPRSNFEIGGGGGGGEGPLVTRYGGGLKTPFLTNSL